MHHLKCSLCSVEQWAGMDCVDAQEPRTASSEDSCVNSMWSMLGLWLLQLDRVLASARATAAPVLETNAFIEAAAAAAQLVAHLLRFAIDPPSIAAGKMPPRKFQVVAFFDDGGKFPDTLAFEAGKDPQIPAHYTVGEELHPVQGANYDRHKPDPRSPTVYDVDEVGLAYYQPLTAVNGVDTPANHSVFYIFEQEREGDRWHLFSYSDNTSFVLLTAEDGLYDEVKVDDMYRTKLLQDEFGFSADDLERYGWGQNTRWATHIRERMFDGLFWHVDHQQRDVQPGLPGGGGSAPPVFVELRGRGLSLQKLVAVLCSLFNHSAMSIAKIGAFDTDDDDMALALHEIERGSMVADRADRAKAQRIQRGRRVICAGNLHRLAEDCVASLERLTKVRHSWVLDVMMKRADGEDHLFVLSVRRIFEHNERVRRRYPIVVAALRLLKAVVVHSANASSKLTMSSVFQQFDENGDKQVSFEEFRNGLHSLGFVLPTKNFDRLVKVLDVNGDGGIDYEEFAKYAAGGAALAGLESKGVDIQVISFFEQIGRSATQAKEQLRALLGAIVHFTTTTLKEHGVWRYKALTQRWVIARGCVELLSSVLERATLLAPEEGTVEADAAAAAMLSSMTPAHELLTQLVHHVGLSHAVLGCATCLVDEYVRTCAAEFHRGVSFVGVLTDEGKKKALKEKKAPVAAVVSVREKAPPLFIQPDFHRGQDAVSETERDLREALAKSTFVLLRRTLTGA